MYYSMYCRNFFQSAQSYKEKPFSDNLEQPHRSESCLSTADCSHKRMTE